MSSDHGPNRLQLERDLYLALLDLHHLDDPAEAVRAALALAARTVGAERGYIEVYGQASSEPTHTFDTGLATEDLALVKARISRGIITEALAAGRTIQTPSALLDHRFSERKSVRQNQIEGVVCSPIGAAPVLGVIYLAAGQARFDDDDVTLLERVVHHLAPVVRRISADPLHIADATKAVRAEIDAHRLVGRSRALALTLEHVRLLRPSDINVLITGPSGTGKSLLARTIHDNSQSCDGPFVQLNCATIPDELLESELFGAKKGGHSTATEAREGKVAAAEGGTLFLDEVAELSLTAQAKLLILLDTKRYFPIGSETERVANVRLISATNADLESRVERGLFRRDLFHRIHVYPIRMPSLAERQEDIEQIAEYLIERGATSSRTPPLPLSTGASFWLQTQEWTGNIRELDNIIAAGLVRAVGRGASEIEVSHFMADDTNEETEATLSYHDATRRFQRTLVHRAYRDAGENASLAAKRLQITRSHFYNLIGIHGRPPPDDEEDK